LATVINEDFGDIPSIDVDGDDHGAYVGGMKLALRPGRRKLWACGTIWFV
jgi:hypothetical protein